MALMLTFGLGSSSGGNIIIKNNCESDIEYYIDDYDIEYVIELDD